MSLGIENAGPASSALTKRHPEYINGDYESGILRRYAPLVLRLLYSTIHSVSPSSPEFTGDLRGAELFA